MDVKIIAASLLLVSFEARGQPLPAPEQETLAQPAAPQEGADAPATPTPPSQSTAPATYYPEVSDLPLPDEPRARPSAVAPPPVIGEGPVRAERRFVLAGEAGWNGLSGMGVNLMFRPIPLLSVDVGGGLSGIGWKGGARVRANILESEWTPTLGAGVIFGSGTLGNPVELTEGANSVRFHLSSAPFLQFVGGVEYAGRGGFTFLATAGYAVRLADNVVIDSGVPTSTQKSAMDIAYGSGLVLSLALGYAF
jgi:hypothetical protein